MEYNTHVRGSVRYRLYSDVKGNSFIHLINTDQQFLITRHDSEDTQAKKTKKTNKQTKTGLQLEKADKPEGKPMY